MNEHECPYGGAMKRWDHAEGDYGGLVTLETCGYNGWLCDRCQQDRADARSHYREDVMEELATLHSQIVGLESEASPQLDVTRWIMESRQRLDALERQVIAQERRLRASEQGGPEAGEKQPTGGSKA